MNESEKQFSFTRAALSTGGRAESKFLSLAELALEHAGDGVHGEEPAGLFGTGPGVLGGEAAAGDQAMEVGMGPRCGGWR